jgi:hypothetical protein
MMRLANDFDPRWIDWAMPSRDSSEQHMQKWTFGLAAMGLSLFIAGATLAQNQPGGNGAAGQAPGQNGGGRGGRNFDPTQMRANMLDRIKTDLGATDEEWTALQPRLEKVLDAQRDARSGRGGFGGGFGGRRGGQGGAGGVTAGATPSTQPVSAVAKASADLKAAIDNKDTPPAELASKLAALRDAKEKAKSDLVTTQKSLKELLTQRQEAILVNMGMLD